MIDMKPPVVRMTVQERGQVTLPKQMRSDMNLKPGDIVLGIPDSRGGYRLERFETMSIDEMYRRWGDATPTTSHAVDRQIAQARQSYAVERGHEYDE